MTARSTERLMEECSSKRGTRQNGVHNFTGI
jgi:hypothetical protein